MIKIESDDIKCPECGKTVYADIYETEVGTELPTESGFHVWCSDNLLDEHCTLTYDQGLDLQYDVYKWLCNNLRKLPI